MVENQSKLTYTYLSNTHTRTRTNTRHTTREFQRAQTLSSHSQSYRQHNPFSHEPTTISIDFLSSAPLIWMKMNHRKWIVHLFCSIENIFPLQNLLLPSKCQRSYLFGMLKFTHALYHRTHSPVSIYVYFAFYATFLCLLVTV